VQKSVTNKSKWLKNTMEIQMSQSRHFEVILKNGNQTKAVMAAKI
jgi:hypothetical protein